MSYQSSDVKLSKKLAYILRHGAHKEGINLSADGFAFVDDLLHHRQMSMYTEADVVRVVQINDKQRFKLETNSATGKLKVRANQGHSVETPDLELKEIQNSEEYPVVVHGTSQSAWRVICKEGLSRMSRCHIHFAKGEPGDNEVISGMRSTCQVAIYIDLPEAMADGLRFYVSSNNVILCSGDASGYIQPKYFREVYLRSPR